MVRHLSGNPTNQDLTLPLRKAARQASPGLAARA